MPIITELGSRFDDVLNPLPPEETPPVTSYMRYPNVLYEIIKDKELNNDGKRGALSDQEQQFFTDPQFAVFDATVGFYECNVNNNEVVAPVQNTISNQTDSLLELEVDCKHLSKCAKCKKKYFEEREKYRKKKKRFIKMYEKLKSAYDLEIAKLHYDKKRWKNLEGQEAELAKKNEDFQRKQVQLEIDFKKREMELEMSIRKRKDILCELARHTKDQNKILTQTMKDMMIESEKLKEKECLFVERVKEAEECLIDKSEALHKQLANVITIIEENAMCVKADRESLANDRTMLGNYNAPLNQNENTKQNHQFIKLKLESLRTQLICLKHAKFKKLTDKCLMTERNCSDLHANVENVDKLNVEERQVVDKNGMVNLALEARMIALNRDNAAMKKLIEKQQEHITTLETEQYRLQANLMSEHLDVAHTSRIQKCIGRNASHFRALRSELSEKIKMNSNINNVGDSQEIWNADNRSLRRLEIEAEALEQSYSPTSKVKNQWSDRFTHSTSNVKEKPTICSEARAVDPKTLVSEVAFGTKHTKNYIETSLEELRKLYVTRNPSYQSERIEVSQHAMLKDKEINEIYVNKYSTSIKVNKEEFDLVKNAYKETENKELGDGNFHKISNDIRDELKSNEDAHESADMIEIKTDKDVKNVHVRAKTSRDYSSLTEIVSNDEITKVESVMNESMNNSEIGTKAIIEDASSDVLHRIESEMIYAEDDNVKSEKYSTSVNVVGTQLKQSNKGSPESNVNKDPIEDSDDSNESSYYDSTSDTASLFKNEEDNFWG